MSELRITHYVVDDIPVISLEGKITIGEGPLILREAIAKHLSGETKALVIELRECRYVDSSGICELVNTFTTTNRKGIRVAYADVGAKLLDLLKITKLLTLFDIYDSVHEAVQSLKEA